MRLLLRRTALAVASRRRSSSTAAMTTDAADAAAARSSLKAAAIAMKKAKKKKQNAAADEGNTHLNLDLAAASFALSPSAALGLDGAGEAADASRGPRVDHLVVSDEGEGEGKEIEDIDLAACVARRSDISRAHALALLELGAVWWCPVPPPPPRSYGTFGPDGAAADSARAAAEERHRAGRERHGRGGHLFQPRRASAGDRPPRGSYVRVHVRPKRYFSLRADDDDGAEEEEEEEESEGEEEESEGEGTAPSSLARVGYGSRAWARRLVAVSSEFAVLNKPPCVPSVPTVDNGVEHALAGAAVGIAEVLRRREVRKERRGRRGEEVEAEEEEEAPTAAAAAADAAAAAAKRPSTNKAPPQATGAAATGGLSAAHRLDHGASGVLAIGRTPRFVAGFQELSKRGRVAKVYRAALLVAAESSNSSSLPRAGDTLVHWAEVNARPHGAPPRTLMFDGPGSSSEDGKERARCELRIVSMKKVSLLPSAAEALGVAATAAAAEEEGKEEVWEACILLITGRTHQIRAQMATVGFPLLGDVLYGTGDYSRVENPNSHEERRRKKEWRSNNGGVVVAVEGEAKDKKEKNPPPLPLDRPIALHAARLASSGRHALKVFGRDPAVFDAGAPWWRAGLGEEDERDLEKALKLRAEMEAEAEAAAARGGEESGSEGGEGEGEPVMLEA